MEKYELVDQITCYTKEIENLVLRSLENRGFSAVISKDVNGKFFIQIIKKIE